MTTANSTSVQTAIFRLSPLIRITLLCLYIALTVPLPFLAEATKAPTPPALLWAGISIGLVGLYAVLSERVVVNDESIQVTYPTWVPRFFRKGWSLSWANVKDLKPRTTGQGGLVYYFLSKEGKAYLLPMRIAGFARLLKTIQDRTGIDTTNVYPLAQPWMYVILLGFTILLLLIDGWTIMTALGQLR
ncbi:MAG: hypothetical protein IGS39_02885 [Calothrix sp. C42_A2020_038]|nr:hypothetical protein [Calothrix sp. C42_A2020_038]